MPIGVGAAILGGAAIGGVTSAWGAHQQQQSSERMADKQMDFQERMSSTAHQRQVADLRKAGLNPILSANSGASSPGGAMGQAQNIAGQGVTGAQNSALNVATLHNMEKQNELLTSQKYGVDTDNIIKGWDAWKNHMKLIAGQKAVKEGKSAYSDIMRGLSEEEMMAEPPPNSGKSVSDRAVIIRKLKERVNPYPDQPLPTDRDRDRYPSIRDYGN